MNTKFINEKYKNDSYTILERIFSIKNIDIYKVICFLGLKFKFKNIRLIKRKQNKKLQLNSLLPKDYPEYLKSWYFGETGNILNLESPKLLMKKIQWMKLYKSTPLKTILADKYLVRDWEKEKIGEEYLIPLLGVWDNFEEIDFNKLPEKFVLKCNHGSGYNITITDKSQFDICKAKK